MQNLQQLPKLRDSLTYLYIEHAILNQADKAIESITKEARTHIPIASLSVLLLGPGTTITHAAIKALAENGCTVIWAGQDTTRFYAQGIGETRKGQHLLRQAELVTDPTKRLQVINRMYRYRFAEELPDNLTLPQIRGMEGVRVRNAYAQASKQHNIPWHGRSYERGNWNTTDPVNRALSAANALLNGLCHAAIVSGGYSPGLGFVHTGKQLSFVYDIADLYKVELTIPAAFQTVAQSNQNIESRVRLLCREKFREARLLQRILPDIDTLLANIPTAADILPNSDTLDTDPALPTELWDAPDSPPQE